LVEKQEALSSRPGEAPHVRCRTPPEWATADGTSAERSSPDAASLSRNEPFGALRPDRLEDIAAAIATLEVAENAGRDAVPRPSRSADTRGSDPVCGAPGSYLPVYSGLRFSKKALAPSF